MDHLISLFAIPPSILSEKNKGIEYSVWKNRKFTKLQIRCFFFFSTQKYLYFFLFVHENIGCGYSLEALCQGASNEYPQHKFSSRNKKKIIILISSYLELCIFHMSRSVRKCTFWHVHNSDQSLCCPHEKILHPWLSRMHPVKILIRMHRLIWVFTGHTCPKVCILMLLLILFLQESISTCRFAQRVALIKNDVLLNEELDPKLMIQKLKREIQQLREELAMATGEQRTDELSEEDLERLVNPF